MLCCPPPPGRCRISYHSILFSSFSPTSSVCDPVTRRHAALDKIPVPHQAFEARFITAIRQFRVIVTALCMNVSYVAGHEGVISLLFQSIMSIL
jgi:hypothetical protein